MDLCIAQDLGIDPQFASYKKVFIKDIRQCTTCNVGTAFVFKLNQTPISKVEAIGIVRRLERRDRKTWLSIDDGTGIMDCVKFYKDTDALPYRDIVVGNMVSIKGMLLKAERNTEPYNFIIQVNLLTKLDDPNLEVLHWMTILHENATSASN